MGTNKSEELAAFWYNKYGKLTPKVVEINAFIAGHNSRQSEIDELTNTINSQKAMIYSQQHLIDGLTDIEKQLKLDKDELTKEVERLRKEREWISVEDELPKVGNWYLVLERNQVNFLFYDSFGIWLSNILQNDGEDSQWHHKITHWQPLPPINQ